MNWDISCKFADTLNGENIEIHYVVDIETVRMLVEAGGRIAYHGRAVNCSGPVVDLGRKTITYAGEVF